MYILLVCCLITVAVETSFFAICGYRKREELKLIVWTNVLTNLSLNLILVLLGTTVPLLVLLEVLVVVSEYLIYAAVFGHSEKLFLLCLAANAISFGTGLFIYL